MKIKELLSIFFSTSLIRAIGLFSSIIVYMILSNQLDLMTFGEISYILSIITLISMVFQLGFPVLIIRARDNLGSVCCSTIKEIRNVYLIHILIWFVPLLILQQFIILKELSFLDNLLIILLSILFSDNQQYGAIKRAHAKYTLAALIETVFRPFTLLLCCFIFFVVNCDFDIKTFLVICFLCYLFLFIFKIIIDSTPKTIFKTLSKNSYVDISKVSFSVGLVGFLALLNQHIDLIFIRNILNTEDAGLYRITMLFSSFCLFPIASINSFLAPMMAKNIKIKNHTHEQNIITKATLIGAIITLIISICIYFIYPQININFLDNKYGDSLNSIMILMVSIFISAIFGPANLVLIMRNREVLILKISIISVCLNILFNPIAIIYYGIEGAAFVTGSCIIFQKIILSYYSYREYGLKTYTKI